MGLSVSRPLRNRPKRLEKLQRSVEDDIVYECDFIRSPISMRGGGGPGSNFQDRIWSKPSKGRTESNIYLQSENYDQTPDDAIKRSDGTTNSTNMKMNKGILDVTPGTVAFESSQVNGDESSCLKEDQTRFQPGYVTDLNHQERSSLSSIHVKLPPVPQSPEAEKKKLPGQECQKTVFERTDPLLNSHDCTFTNQTTIGTSITAKDSETTVEAGFESDEVEILENESSDDQATPGVTMQSDNVVGKKSEEEITGHGSVITDPGCDAATRDLLIQETKLADCEYEPLPDNYGYRVSYKSGEFVLNDTSRQVNRFKHPVASLHPSAQQPLKPQAASVSELPSFQPQPTQSALQPQHIPQPQASRPSSVDANSQQLHQHQVRHRVDPGNLLRIPGLTVSLPAQINPGESYVELLWTSSDFPVLSVDHRFLTDVLHCILHGSAFTSPVVVTLDLPVNQGQIEVFYSPTNVDQIHIWRKLRAIEGYMGGATRFTDGQSPLANKVLLLKNRRKAVLVLRHFGSFVVVENGSVVQPREAEVAIFLQTKMICDDESWSAIVMVVVGCDKNDMCRKQKSLRDKGYRLMEKTGLLLYRTQDASGVEVGIRDVEWMAGCTQKQSKTSMIHSLDCLWNGMEASSLFWMTSKGSKQKEEQLTFTVYVRQDGRMEKPIGIYCDVTNVHVHDQRRLPFKPRRTVVTATRSSPAILKTPFKLHHEGYTTTTSPDSDLSLKTEDVSSRRHDDAISDSDQDFELNYCANDKALFFEDVGLSNSRTLCSKRLSHFVEDTENVGMYKLDSVPSMAKVANRLELYSAEDVNRITATAGINLINQSDLDWILSG